MKSWQIIGIDPAPKKAAVAYDGKEWTPIPPAGLRNFVEARLAAKSATLIAWDAPLSFNADDYNDRTVDKVVRAWIVEGVRKNRFAVGSVNAQRFSAVPHWAVTCGTLGHPFGQPPAGLRLAAAVDDCQQGPLAIEVHPAVAIGALWIDKKIAAPLPIYKGTGQRFRTASERIAGDLGFPQDAGRNDDYLDAYVAYLLGKMFTAGHARWLGSPDEGGYVMPQGGCANYLSEKYLQANVTASREV